MSHPGDARSTTAQSQEQPAEVASPDEIIHAEHPPASLPRVSPSEAYLSDSGFSVSSSSSGEIIGTPFDFASQPYEYPFPATHAPSPDTFSPHSSSMTITASSNLMLPSWPPQIQNSFPLTAPPVRKVRTHPKLRTVAVREPPVPPSLVNKRSIWGLGLQRQLSAESQQSDISDTPTHSRKLSPYKMGFAELAPHSASDSEIAVRKRDASARSSQTASPCGSRKDATQAVANPSCAPDAAAEGVSVSSGSNGADKQLVDLRPGGAPDRINVSGSSFSEILRIVAGRRG